MRAVGGGLSFPFLHLPACLVMGFMEYSVLVYCLKLDSTMEFGFKSLIIPAGVSIKLLFEVFTMKMIHMLNS